MSFETTLRTHLDAIQRRDLPAFVATLTSAPELTLILPNGALISGRDEVISFNAEWFADPDWRLSYETVRTLEAGAMAFALLLVTYDDLDASGQPYQIHYYLQLVFRQEDGAWRLVHDQNTSIPAPR